MKVLCQYANEMSNPMLYARLGKARLVISTWKAMVNPFVLHNANVVRSEAHNACCDITACCTWCYLNQINCHMHLCFWWPVFPHTGNNMYCCKIASWIVLAGYTLLYHFRALEYQNHKPITVYTQRSSLNIYRTKYCATFECQLFVLYDAWRFCTFTATCPVELNMIFYCDLATVVASY